MPVRSLRLYILFIGQLLCTTVLYAQEESEKKLVEEIVSSLQVADDSSFAGLFPTMELMTEKVYEYQPKNDLEAERIQQLRINMKYLRDFDPAYNEQILGMMNFAHNKGADSGIHWGDIAIVKYELDKQRLPYELIGWELIATYRMQGYIIIRDMLTRKRYGIAVRDIFMINDKWYGGTILNVLEASSAAEYEESLAEEEKQMAYLMKMKEMGLLDSVLAVRDSIRESKIKVSMMDEEMGLNEEVKEQTQYKDIMDRKVFSGYFDKLLEVVVYIRYIKGTCPETICEWEAMYFVYDDMDEFVPLEVEKKPDGTFVFTEDEVGVMELKQQGDVLTGTWTSMADGTEYEVYLKEKKELKDKKLFKLDKQYEEIYWR